MAADARIVRGRQLIADVEGNFPELTLEIGRRHRLGTTIVVEWTCNYGDGRLYRNVTIGELVDGTVTHITDYWGEPVETPNWRKGMTDRLECRQMASGKTQPTSAGTDSTGSPASRPASSVSLPGTGSGHGSRPARTHGRVYPHSGDQYL